MQPDIGNLIQGIKRSLNEEILPAVAGTFAREQVAYTLFLCEHLARRWDQAHVFAAEEYGDLRATLTAAVHIGRRCTTLPPDLTTALGAAAAALAMNEPSDPRPLRDLTAGVDAMKRILVRILDACEPAMPADHDAVSEMRGVLRGFMKRQLARDEQWVEAAQVGWW